MGDDTNHRSDSVQASYSYTFLSEVKAFACIGRGVVRWCFLVFKSQ